MEWMGNGNPPANSVHEASPRKISARRRRATGKGKLLPAAGARFTLSSRPMIRCPPWPALCALVPLLLACTAVGAADPAPPEFRLGDPAAPIDYALHLAIDPRETRFSGDIRIHLRFSRAAPVLWLDATGLDIDQV